MGKDNFVSSWRGVQTVRERLGLFAHSTNVQMIRRQPAVPHYYKQDWESFVFTSLSSSAIEAYLTIHRNHAISGRVQASDGTVYLIKLKPDTGHVWIKTDSKQLREERHGTVCLVQLCSYNV